MTAQTPHAAPETATVAIPSQGIRATADEPVGTRATRAAALSGVVFAGTVIASGVITFNAPNTDAKTATIRHYILTHQGRYGLSAMLAVLAVISGLAFGAYLRTLLRNSVSEALLTTFFAGVVIFGISGCLSAGVSFAMSDQSQLLSSDSLRLLNSINQNLNWAPLCVGLTLIYGATALMIRSARKLPAWTAWLSWTLAVLSATFFLSFITFIATPIVAIVASVRLAQRNPSLTRVIRL